MLFSVAACEAPRLPTLMQGKSVSAEPNKSSNQAEAKAANDENVPYTPQATQQQPAQSAEETPGAKTPSLVPFLTGQARGQSQPLPGENAPITPLAPSSTTRAALLVPITGPNARLGKAMLNAAQMAVFDFSDQKFELLIHDTQGTPEGAMEAARLAIGDGASVILGPLLGASVRAISLMTRAANVPVIGFSSDRTITGDGVYTMGFFPETEVERVVSYAYANGSRNFAALAPDDAYGQAIVESLQKTAAMLGANVSRVQFFDPEASDYSPVVRELANYDIRRQALLDQREELSKREDEIAIKALERLEKLQTIGDPPFDALILADGGERLLAIAALLPFYDVDPKKVRMLGTGQWDAPGLGGEPALSGGLYAGPPPDARAEFEVQYRGVYGEEPMRLTTLAYDATALAAVLARAEGGADFSSRAMTMPGGFWGRDGIFRFLANGNVDRGLAVLRLGSQGSKVVSKAPETFDIPTN